MARITIRAARASDAGEIARLTTQLGYDLTKGDAADRLSRTLARGDQQFLVADAGGGAVGWVHVVFAEYVDAEAFVVIGGLVVDREHRRLVRRRPGADEPCRNLGQGARMFDGASQLQRHALRRTPVL